MLRLTYSYTCKYNNISFVNIFVIYSHYDPGKPFLMGGYFFLATPCIYIYIYSINFLIIFTNRYSELHANAIFKRLSYTLTVCFIRVLLADRCSITGVRCRTGVRCHSYVCFYCSVIVGFYFGLVYNAFCQTLSV